jgi:hypothetical protein
VLISFPHRLRFLGDECPYLVDRLEPGIAAMLKSRDEVSISHSLEAEGGSIDASLNAVILDLV